MNVVRTLLGVSLALVAVAPPAHAEGGGAGTSTANFLSLGTGAAALGMGGAGVARWGSLELVGWNPASLGFLDGTRLAFSHAVIDEGTNQSWASLGGRLGALSTRWALSGQYQGEGSFEGRDASGLPTGTFDVASMAFGAHVAQPLGGIVTAGVGAKYVGERIGDVSGSGFVVDVGLQARLGPAALGAAAQNAFGEMRYDGTSYPTPENYAVGASLALPGQVTLAVDANLPRDYYQDLRMGAEWRAFGVMALRGGYRMELDAPDEEALDGPSFGIGGGFGGLWLDYGYSLEGHGDGQHRLAVNVHPGAFAPGAGLFGAAEPEASRTPRPLSASKPVENEPAPVKASAPKVEAERAETKDDEPAKPVVAPTRAAKVSAPAPAAVAPLPKIADAEREGRSAAPTQELTREVETPAAKTAPVPVRLARSRPRAAAPLPEDARAQRPAPVKAEPVATPQEPGVVEGKVLDRSTRTAKVKRYATTPEAKPQSLRAERPARVETPAPASPKPGDATFEATPNAADEAKSETPKRSKSKREAPKSNADDAKLETPKRDQAKLEAPKPKDDDEAKAEAKAPKRDGAAKAEATPDKPARDEIAEPGKAKRPKFTKMSGSAKKKKARDFDDVAREAAELAEKKTGK